jgi:hypothetical protein
MITESVGVQVELSGAYDYFAGKSGVRYIFSTGFLFFFDARWLLPKKE